jgi:hypothetical protein
MYPHDELTRLAAHKATLRRDIAVNRAHCNEVAAGVMRPVEWVDEMLALWRRVSPLARIAAVPLGFVIKRTLFRRSRLVGSLVSWGPLVASVLRGIGATITTRK